MLLKSQQNLSQVTSSQERKAEIVETDIPVNHLCVLDKHKYFKNLECWTNLIERRVVTYY